MATVFSFCRIVIPYLGSKNKIPIGSSPPRRLGRPQILWEGFWDANRREREPLSLPARATAPPFPFCFPCLECRLLQLRLEKEDLEEELREQIGALQKDLDQARASAKDNRQVENLKKVTRQEWGYKRAKTCHGAVSP